MKLRDILTVERVATRLSVPNWEEAVRAAGRLLVETGGAEPSYVEGMIRTAKELGPYIVIAPGIALPHSRPEDGVLAPCVSVITLDPPIAFGNAENDPVHLVIAFGAVDHQQHVDALRDLATILSEPSNVEALFAAQTKEDLLAVLWSLPAEQ